MALYKTIRKNYWVAQSFIRRHYKTILVATLVGTAILGLISIFGRYIPSPKKHVRVALIGKYTPENIPTPILNLVSSGLVLVTEDGTILPGLAEKWEIQEDGKTYIFHLRDDLKWHDGSRVKPEDISYNFKEVEKETTDRSVIFRLKEPFSPFTSAVAKPLLKRGRFGVGDYKIASIKAPGSVLQSLTLVGSEKKLTYKFYPTEDTAITAFKLGEVDRIEGLTFVPDELREERGILISAPETSSRIAALFFNNQDTVLSGKSARQGLAYAIRDKSFGGKRAFSPISELSWAYNPNVKTYDFDASRAKELFEQDVESPDGITIQIKTMLQHLDMAEQIARDWEEVLGVKVEVKVTTSISEEFQAVLVDFEPPLDPDQYTIWHSTQSTNFTRYQNLKVDKLLEDGRRTVDPEIRATIYMDFQRFLLEDSPAVFLFHTSNFVIERASPFAKK